MSRLGDQERKELEDMRDALVQRIEHLQTQVDYGNISDEERYKLLTEEFGEGYLETLSGINEMLYAQETTSRVAPRTLIASVLGIFLFGLAISALFTFSPTAFMVLGTETLLEPNQLLQAGQTQRLDLPQQTVITRVQLTNPTTLVLEDAQRTLTLYEDGKCVGCGQNIQGPYLITNRGETYTTIQQLGVLEQ